MLLFRAAGRLCACELDAVREIVAARPATRLPGAPAWIDGLVNVRGTLLTVVDLAVRFGAARAEGSAGSIVIVSGAGKVFGLRVDGVRDVRTLGGDALEPVDAQRDAGGVVKALAHVGAAGDESALVCDIEAIAREALAVQDGTTTHG
ncbi:MAG: purine-binding chemotaxis protein CheW [Gemmatimonadetes bacterium]|nr:purine-binding chemotaxis protein CheW [Gemmatimonadota bacterium]MBI3567325.1 purine-binding chemotaxis protein CheW [Gemmatimonadota bacterium]